MICKQRFQWGSSQEVKPGWLKPSIWLRKGVKGGPDGSFLLLLLLSVPAPMPPHLLAAPFPWSPEEGFEELLLCGQMYTRFLSLRFAGHCPEEPLPIHHPINDAGWQLRGICVGPQTAPRAAHHRTPRVSIQFGTQRISSMVLPG